MAERLRHSAPQGQDFEQVLCLLPHQDDEFAILAEIEAAVAAGSDVVCVYLTDGGYGGQSTERRDAESLRVLDSLGVRRENVHFLGSELGIADCSLHERLVDAEAALRRTLPASGSSRILIPAWEGGHHDHDATHLLGLLLVRARLAGQTRRATTATRAETTALQYPIYNGYKLRGSFFRVLFPLAHNGPIVNRRVPWADRLRHLRYCLSYPSQWKTWVGLFPLVFLHYLIVGKQRLQSTDPSRVASPPHTGVLLYERRGFCTWAEFAKRTEEIRATLSTGA